jgi:hypothetical protein
MSRITENALRRIIRQMLLAEGGMGYPVDMEEPDASETPDPDLAGMSDSTLQALASSSSSGSDTQAAAQAELSRRAAARRKASGKPDPHGP